MSRSGWPRQPDETPSQYANRLAGVEHPSAATLQLLTRHYLQLRYAGRTPTPADWLLLRQLLRRLQSRPLNERSKA